MKGSRIGTKHELWGTLSFKRKPKEWFACLVGSSQMRWSQKGPQFHTETHTHTCRNTGLKTTKNKGLKEHRERRIEGTEGTEG